MTARQPFRAVVALALFATVSSIRAEELGLPKRCVELEKIPSSGVWSDAISLRDSVQFSLVSQSGKGTSVASQSFVAWDLETGKLLARRPLPDASAFGWMFSPDGKLLAVPVDDHARTVQLWEVGSKDIQGVPQMRLIAKLPQRKVLPNEPQSFGRPRGTTVNSVVWTLDSKTVLVYWAYYPVTSACQILFWSFTDKPSVMSDSKQDESDPTAWKPWAKLEFDTEVAITVSPDNQTLAVIQQRRKRQILVEGHFFDPQTAQPREKFTFEPGSKSDAEILWDYRPTFSPDSKALAITGGYYFALWDTPPLTPRFEMSRPDFLERGSRQLLFTPDGRWLLTHKAAESKDVRSHKGGLLQVRDAQSGKVHLEVTFPKQLGLLYGIEGLPDGRVRTIFLARSQKQSQSTDHREFLWHADDLLCYATEHGSQPR